MRLGGVYVVSSVGGCYLPPVSVEPTQQAKPVGMRAMPPSGMPSAAMMKRISAMTRRTKEIMVLTLFEVRTARMTIQKIGVGGASCDSYSRKDMLEALLAFGKKGPASLGYAFFAGGYATTTYTERYDYATKVRAPGVALGTGRHTSAGASNSDTGLIAGGESSNLVDRYATSSGARVQGSNLSVARGYLAGAGNEGAANFYGGQGSPGNRRTDRYVYGNDSVSTGTSLTADRLGIAGTGTATLSLLHGNSPVSNRYDKYAYAPDTWTTGTNGALAREGPSGFSTPTVGYFAGGKASNGQGTNYTESYTYATNAILARTSMTVARFYSAAGGNATEAVFGAGWNASGSVALDTTDRYLIAGDTWTAGTSLGMTRTNLSGFSSVPGGL